jgi:hypothetical protein
MSRAGVCVGVSLVLCLSTTIGVVARNARKPGSAAPHSSRVASSNDVAAVLRASHATTSSATSAATPRRTGGNVKVPDVSHGYSFRHHVIPVLTKMGAMPDRVTERPSARTDSR